MKFLDRLPKLDQCCCVTNLKTAAAIIAVLGIVTNPASTWAVVRHSYIVGMSCFVSTNIAHPDMVDVTLNKIVHFGFGRNAGLGPSCVVRPDKKPTEIPVVAYTNTSNHKNEFIAGVYVFGWCVLTVDCIFVIVSVAWLVLMFYGNDRLMTLAFMAVGLIAVLISFIYSMLYIAACTSAGGAFPLFEFFFSIIDLIVWTYFLLVVNSYRRISD